MLGWGPINKTLWGAMDLREASMVPKEGIPDSQTTMPCLMQDILEVAWPHLLRADRCMGREVCHSMEDVWVILQSATANMGQTWEPCHLKLDLECVLLLAV